MDWTNLINTLGFPIVVSGCAGWMVYTMYNNSIKENAIRELRNYEMLAKFQVSIDKFADILEGYEKKLTSIETDVKEIKTIVNK